MHTNYRVGDRVVYTCDKATPTPSRRAKNIYPCPAGELYHYQVDKYWIVKEVRDDMTLVLQTRSGKEHQVDCSDPRLRRASIWERWTKTHLFPSRSAVAPTPHIA